MGFQQEFVRRVLTDIDVAVYVCPQLLDEIKDVSSRSKVKDRIKNDDVDDLFNLIAIFCHNALITNNAVSNIRDAKDLYLLSLAETIHAEYIISGDKDLIALKSHLNTKISTIADFKYDLGI